MSWSESAILGQISTFQRISFTQKKRQLEHAFI